MESFRRAFFFVISIVYMIIPSAFSAQSEGCVHSLRPDTLQVEWTAFKTSQKVPVKGSFTDVVLFGDLKHRGSFQAFLEQVEADLKIISQDSIQTGNPGRDLTIFQKFFSAFSGPKKIHGRFSEIKGSDQEGKLKLVLTLNGKKLAVPMDYTRTDKGAFMARGAIDLLDFKLQSAFQSLHEACKELHKGPDGVSKTWSTVEIRILATVVENCKK